MRTNQKNYESRKSLLYQIHTAKKDLALTDYEYEGIVEGITGETSCGKVTDRVLLARVVARMKERGWKGMPPMQSRIGTAPVWSEGCEGVGGKMRAILLDTGKSWGYAQGIATKMFDKALGVCGFAECNAVLAALIKHQGAYAKKSAQGGAV